MAAQGERPTEYSQKVKEAEQKVVIAEKKTDESFTKLIKQHDIIIYIYGLLTATSLGLLGNFVDRLAAGEKVSTTYKYYGLSTLLLSAFFAFLSFSLISDKEFYSGIQKKLRLYNKK